MTLLSSFRSVTQQTGTLANNKNMRLQKNVNLRRQTKSRMQLIIDVPLLYAKPPQELTMITHLYMPENKIIVSHTQTIGMMCCGNLALVTTGTTETITSL